MIAVMKQFEWENFGIVTQQEDAFTSVSYNSVNIPYVRIYIDRSGINCMPHIPIVFNVITQNICSRYLPLAFVLHIVTCGPSLVRLQVLFKDKQNSMILILFIWLPSILDVTQSLLCLSLWYVLLPYIIILCVHCGSILFLHIYFITDVRN